MSVDARQYNLTFKAECSRKVPGGSPGLHYHSDRGWPDDRTLQYMIDQANESLKNCRFCIGVGCQTWELARASLEQVRELVLGNRALLESTSDQ